MLIMPARREDHTEQNTVALIHNTFNYPWTHFNLRSEKENGHTTAVNASCQLPERVSLPNNECIWYQHRHEAHARQALSLYSASPPRKKNFVVKNVRRVANNSEGKNLNPTYTYTCKHSGVAGLDTRETQRN